MSQTYTDDCFAGSHIAQTDMQNIENNFAAVKSQFAGAAAPSNPVAGMRWFDSDDGMEYTRNKTNTAWVSGGFVSGTIILFGQASAPLGFTKVTSWADNSMLCINSEANGTALATGGSANPEVAHTHTGPAHTHTGPAHTHTISYTSTQSATTAGSGLTFSRIDSGSTGSEGSGATSSSGTGATGANTVFLYHEVIAASKD